MQQIICDRCEREISREREEEGELGHFKPKSLFSLGESYHFTLCEVCKKDFKCFMELKMTKEMFKELVETTENVMAYPLRGKSARLKFNRDANKIQRGNKLLKEVKTRPRPQQNITILMDDKKERLNTPYTPEQAKEFIQKRTSKKNIINTNG